MKSKDLRALGLDELREKLEGAVKELYHMRVRTTTKELENTSLIPKQKRDIARLRQIIGERDRKSTRLNSSHH